MPKLCAIPEPFKFRLGIYFAASQPFVNAMFHQNSHTLLRVNIALIVVLLENMAKGIVFLDVLLTYDKFLCSFCENIAFIVQLYVPLHR